MTGDLKDLYQDLIMDHQRHPRNHRAMAQCTSQARGFNPLCGDQLTVYCRVENDVVHDVSFVGCGCAISQASASLMTDALIGLSLDDAHALFLAFHAMLTEEQPTLALNHPKLQVFAGVRAFPARVKCATLAWHTLEAALKHETRTVVTE